MNNSMFFKTSPLRHFKTSITGNTFIIKIIFIIIYFFKTYEMWTVSLYR